MTTGEWALVISLVVIPLAYLFMLLAQMVVRESGWHGYLIYSYVSTMVGQVVRRWWK